LSAVDGLQTLGRANCTPNKKVLAVYRVLPIAEEKPDVQVLSYVLSKWLQTHAHVVQAAFAERHFDQDFTFGVIEEDPVTRKVRASVLLGWWQGWI
jgi:hypothetical protein